MKLVKLECISEELDRDFEPYSKDDTITPFETTDSECDDSVNCSVTAAQVTSKVQDLSTAPANLLCFAPIIDKKCTCGHMCTLAEKDIRRDTAYNNVYLRKVKHSLESIGGNKRKKTNRVQTNYHCCLLCGKLVSNFRKHILTHRTHVEVAKLMEIKKRYGHSQYVKRLKMLSNFGDNRHNITVRDSKEGELIIARCPQAAFHLQEYVPCIGCLEWQRRKSLHRHKCDATNSSIFPHHTLSCDVVIGNILQTASSSLRINLYPAMQDDHLTEVAKSDTIIVMLGNHVLSNAANKKSSSINYTSYINHMRLAAKLLCQIRNITGLQTRTMYSFLNPEYFDNVCKSAVNLAMCEDNSADELNVLSPTALKVGDLISQMVGLKLGLCIRSSNGAHRNMTEEFHNLMKNEWKAKVLGLARSILCGNQIDVFHLPELGDLIRLVDYLKEKINRCELDFVNPTYQTYSEVIKYVMVRLLVNNKRRNGELEHTLLTNYEYRFQELATFGTSLVQSDLTWLEKDVLSKQEIIYIRGHVGHVVPVLIPTECTKPLSFIADKHVRAKIGIQPDSVFLFANRGNDVTSVYDLLREVCHEADVQHPERINSATLRAYISTLTQVLNLEDDQLIQVTAHLFHSLDAQHMHYKQCSGNTERVNIAKVMMMKDYGVSEKFYGQSIDDISLADIVEESKLKPVADQVADLTQVVQPDEDGDVCSTDARATVSKAKKSKTSKRLLWSAEENAEVAMYFGDYLKSGNCPKQKFVETIRSRSKLEGGTIHLRDWSLIKKKVWNMIQANKNS